MRYDPTVHHRRSIRLPGYDYSQSGAYFVAVCTNNRRLFLTNDTVRDVVQSTWNRLPSRFRNLSLDEFIIMPNHVHGILVLAAEPADVPGKRDTLSAVVGAFKSISAILANRALGRSGVPFWQRNYYEHVIRSEEKLNQIRQYIRDNPAKWAEDPNNPYNIRRPKPTFQRRGLRATGAGAGQTRAPTG
jgi:putative transposase